MPRSLLPIAATGFIVVAIALAGCSRTSPQRSSSESGDVGSPLLRPEAITALKPVIRPQLGEPMAREPSVEDTVADALARIGGDAVPELIKTLEDPDPEVQTFAARSLAMMGPNARTAVPSLVKHLHDSDERVRRACARALGQIGPAAGAAVPELIKLLKEEGSRRR